LHRWGEIWYGLLLHAKFHPIGATNNKGIGPLKTENCFTEIITIIKTTRFSVTEMGMAGWAVSKHA